MVDGRRNPAIGGGKVHGDTCDILLHCAEDDGRNSSLFMADEGFISAAFCSGYGQYHSAENESEDQRRPYVDIKWTDIIERMKNPQNVPKSGAQWAIFSTHPSRTFEEQRQKGRFHVLAVDLDRDPPPVKDAVVRISNLVRADVCTYTSRSAKWDEPKSRTLIPLATPIDGRRYELLQACLNDRLEAGGLTPDRATERAAQLHYLPNRGEYYETATMEFLGTLDWQAEFGEELAAKEAKLADHEASQRRRQEESARKLKERQQRQEQTGERSPIDAYNAAYSLREVWESFGATWHGRRGRSPISTSGTYGITLSDDGQHWHSFHASDVEAGIGTTDATAVGCWGDAFDLFVYFEHDGDRNAALKAVGDMFQVEPGVTLSMHNQRAFMQAQSHPSPEEEFASQADQAAERQPRPLPDPMPPVPPFDAEKLLPAPLRGYAEDVAHRQQSPIEYCAVAALVGLAAVVGRKILMRPKQHDDWTITANLWGALIGGPSAMKSPALGAMRFPLDDIEADARRAHEQMQAIHIGDAEIAEMEHKAAKKRAEKLVAEGKSDEAKTVLEEVDSLAEPPEHPPRLIVNDATVEALGEKLNENPNGVLLLRDELYGWVAKMQQEEYASDRAFYLECFNGSGRYTYDRIGRGTVAVEHCILSIIGGIQPARIAKLVRGTTRGTDDDGLLQRFQLAVHPDPVPSWRWVDRPPSRQARERYQGVFYQLHALPAPPEDGEPPHRHFSQEAQAEFIRWSEALHREARSGDLPPAMEAHLLKMPKTVCSLALLFALVNGEEEAVGYDATLKALAWADLLRRHAERLYSAATSQNVLGAKLILSRREKLPQPFKAKQVQQRGWAGLDTTEAVGAALDLLEDHGYLTPIETRTGGRPRVDYYWHPSLVTSAEHHSKAAGDTPRNPPKRALRGLRGVPPDAAADNTPNSAPSEGLPDDDDDWLH
ncbi:YfjI family protein [Halomonas sp. CS7]|uniref:YfjI family protein n=1 Tax=Halomonas pelophila TaxID=3151122 RepID=A0ABV1N5U3_9GAMM